MIAIILIFPILLQVILVASSAEFCYLRVGNFYPQPLQGNKFWNLLVQDNLYIVHSCFNIQKILPSKFLHPCTFLKFNFQQIVLTVFVHEFTWSVSHKMLMLKSDDFLLENLRKWKIERVGHVYQIKQVKIWSEIGSLWHNSTRQVFFLNVVSHHAEWLFLYI